MYRLLAAGLRYPGLGTLTPEQNPDVQRQFYTREIRTPPQLKLCLGKNATELPQRAGQKIAGPGVPKCRFRFFRYVALQIEGMLKYVVRRGKELVKQAFISTGNE